MSTRTGFVGFESTLPQPQTETGLAPQLHIDLEVPLNDTEIWNYIYGIDNMKDTDDLSIQYWKLDKSRDEETTINTVRTALFRNRLKTLVFYNAFLCFLLLESGGLSNLEIESYLTISKCNEPTKMNLRCRQDLISNRDNKDFCDTVRLCLYKNCMTFVCSILTFLFFISFFISLQT